MLIVFLRTLILYTIVVVGMRIMGKRQLGELQPSELVTTILISNIATLPIEDAEVPLLSGAVPILTLMSFELLLSCLSLRSLWLRKLISGQPRIIIRGGAIDQQEMDRLRYSPDDLMEQLRVSGVFDLQEVELAMVETNGQLSIVKKAPYQEATQQDLGLQSPAQQIPAVVVSSGKAVDAGLRYCGLSPEALEKLAKKNGQAVQDIFLMTCTPDRTVFLVPKNETGTKKKKGGKRP